MFRLIESVLSFLAPAKNKLLQWHIPRGCVSLKLSQ